GAVTTRESATATRLPAVNLKFGKPDAVRIAFSAGPNCGTSAVPSESVFNVDAMLCGVPTPISSSYRVHDVSRRKPTARLGRTVASGMRLVVDCADARPGRTNAQHSTTTTDRKTCRTDNRK